MIGGRTEAVRGAHDKCRCFCHPTSAAKTLRLQSGVRKRRSCLADRARPLRVQARVGPRRCPAPLRPFCSPLADRGHPPFPRAGAGAGRGLGERLRAGAGGSTAGTPAGGLRVPGGASENEEEEEGDRRAGVPGGPSLLRQRLGVGEGRLRGGRRLRPWAAVSAGPCGCWEAGGSPGFCRGTVVPAVGAKLLLFPRVHRLEPCPLYPFLPSERPRQLAAVPRLWLRPVSPRVSPGRVPSPLLPSCALLSTSAGDGDTHMRYSAEPRGLRAAFPSVGARKQDVVV